MKYREKNISIKSIVIFVFISAMMVSIGGIGSLIFTNWLSSAGQITESIAGDINESIYNKISSFMQVPFEINEANKKIISNGILDITDESLREKFFVGVLNSYDDMIYSFSYGTVSGEYYGARRNEHGITEIMRNNAVTGGSSWYYAVNDDLTAGSLVVRAGKFDPRTREWYKAAVEAEGPVFSPVYKHFIMNDLTVSAATPVYDGAGELRGVLGTHMLLTGIGSFLETAVKKYDGYAVIIEKESGYLIANSTGADNFSVAPDGTPERYGIDRIDIAGLIEAYERYNTSSDPHFLYKGTDHGLYVNVKEFHMEGLDWVVVSAFPEGLLITPVVRSIFLTVLLSALALILSFVIYNIIIGKLLRPVSNLLQVAAALSSGDLTRRADIVRNDEIGGISESLNKVADKMQYLINNLEANVRERTEQLHRVNITLEENKNQLRLILDSAAEGIYGTDLDGNCTFCNTSCLKLLGYSRAEELLGKNVHYLFHHSRPDGTPFPIEDCKIFQSFRQSKGFEADDEVFFRADGSSFAVEYHSYPQIKNGRVVGAVITFTDITERRQREEEIRYLGCHDILTGLINRRCLEETLARTDIPGNLPLSVVFADINGLKMTNDIFGHAAGDKLIKKSAEVLKMVCRENDVIARVGGDEFIILLPGTNRDDARKIITRIRSGLTGARVAAIKCSISLGTDTKTSAGQSFEEVMANAENAMYKDKTINRKSVNKDIIDTIIGTLHIKSPEEKRHSEAVSELCVEIGTALHLPETELNKLKRAGYMHDIGKIIIDESILLKDALPEEECETMQQHSVVGYRILNLFDDTLDLAEYVYSHHERWDGTGYPRGLKGSQIPLISRIISVAEIYDRVRNGGEGITAERKREAVRVIAEGAGMQFDPEIAGLFARMMQDKVK